MDTLTKCNCAGFCHCPKTVTITLTVAEAEVAISAMRHSANEFISDGADTIARCITEVAGKIRTAIK